MIKSVKKSETPISMSSLNFLYKNSYIMSKIQKTICIYSIPLLTYSSYIMITIARLQQEINGRNRKEIIDSLEEEIAEDIEKVTKEKQFFNFPLNNILNIVSKTDLLEQEDPISLIKTIITKTIENHPKEKETLLLLHSLKTNDIELTLEESVDILSLFTQCDIFIQLEKEIEELKQEKQ